MRMTAVGRVGGALLLVGLLLGADAGARAQSLPPTPTPAPTATSTPTSTPTAAPPPQVVTVVATPTAPPPTPAPTGTPVPPGYGPARCPGGEETLESPCAIPTELDVTDLPLPGGATRVFSALLKGGRDYRITAAVPPGDGADPLLDVLLAGETAPVAQNDDAALGSPTAAVTLTVAAEGWYLFRVVNQAPAGTPGRIALSARSVAPAAGGSAPGPTPAPSDNPADLVGNAYDPDHAVLIGWNVPYDLSFQCPDRRPRACTSGRHTFLLVAVKAKVPITAVTYDLQGGADPLLTAYAPDSAQTLLGAGQWPGWHPLAANDDAAPGRTLRAQLTLTPSWTGLLLLVVAPSDRKELPRLPADACAGCYKLIVGGPQMEPVRRVLEAQTDLPTPTPLPPTPAAQQAPVVPTPAADSREVVKGDCPRGLARTRRADVVLFGAAPPTDRDRLAAYPEGADVVLQGQCFGGWVKVQPVEAVQLGWMWGPDLAPVELGPAQLSTSTTVPVEGRATPATAPTSEIPGMPGLPGDQADLPAVIALPVTVGPIQVVRPTPASALAPEARTITVQVCRAGAVASTCGAPLAGVLAVLQVVATSQQLAQGRTDASGLVRLPASVAPGTALRLRVPALGVQRDLDAATDEVPVLLPAGGGQ